MSQANVRSVDALKEFKLSLVNFQEDARNALTTVDMQIRQMRNWLERDQLSYWKGQIKKCQEAVMQARADLHRRQLSQQNSDAVSDAEQKENLRIAQRKLREAEEKVERIKKWIPMLEHAIAEYNSQSQPLADRLSGRLVESFNVLDRMIGALESYMALNAPSAPDLAATGGSAGGPAPKPGSAATPGTASGGGEATTEAAPAEASAEPAAQGTATEPAQQDGSPAPQGESTTPVNA